MINPHCSSRCILCMLEWTSQILDMNEDKKAEEKFYDKNAVVDECFTKGDKWDRLDGMEISGRGYDPI